MVDYKISWHRGNDLSEKILSDCSELFSNHYGFWGPAAQSSLIGKRVKLSPCKLLDYLKAPESWATLAYADDILIGYAFFMRLHIPHKGFVTWVTQFVVHADHRGQGLGTRLLRAIWSVSDQYAWGLVTANPYAVRALEKATLRDCNPVRIRLSSPQLFEAAKPYLSYVAEAEAQLRSSTTAFNTNFPVDHSNSIDALHELQSKGAWLLGDLEESEEWMAFTFSDQAYSESAPALVDAWIKDCDLTVRDAYNGMLLDGNHAWIRHTPHEIDVFIEYSSPTAGQLIFDYGCGAGRHSIELAKRGFRVLGIDFVPSLIETAQQNPFAIEQKNNVRFECADIRHFKSEEKADQAICLYDVVGSFAADSENKKLLENIFANLKPGGHLLVSVMNGELTASLAIHKATNNLAEKLLQLEPSNIMQSTGNVFDPNYYLWDEKNEVAYRKEQFSGETIAPCELIVRDRRYSSKSLINILQEVGFDVCKLKFVRLGNWRDDLDAVDSKAKEILILCKRPE